VKDKEKIAPTAPALGWTRPENYLGAMARKRSYRRAREGEPRATPRPPLVPSLRSHSLHRPPEGPAATREELQGKLRTFRQRLGKLPEHIQSYFEHPNVAYAAPH